MDFDGRNRSRNGATKRTREEMESFTPGVGSKSKPCMKFFSFSGCPFGEGCHFSHYVPGGYKAPDQFTNVGGPLSRKPFIQQSFTDGPAPPMKSKLCNKLNTPEGCKFGDNCRYAHSEAELGGRPYENPRGPMNYSGHGGYQGQFEPSLPAVANFGQSATAKISIDAALAGPVIGKGGVNSKHICRQTGVKLHVRDHETDEKQKNIELEGSFDQIQEASAMVRDIIVSLSATTGGGRKGSGFQLQQQQQQPGGGNNFKTKMCENFAKGQCSFGDRCHFAHGADELRT
ncbi:zinc finger CCCH domain-containing protein 14-like [Rutidosis leptorrhynchoides]|uniref:zinc finger CCCH domain-containing protein 14-like n=1 Tax=Rutidosis leptorrhynchoides TaxID=125765 RepID=UPI003A9A4B45